MSGLLVTGTDTGVGKTWVACLLARALREAGLRVGVMKPCETGLSAGDVAGLPQHSDAALLAEAAGCSAPSEDVLPYRFALPAAPSVAAREAGSAIDVEVIVAAYERLLSAHDVVLVEGAGGLLVPLATGYDYFSLAQRLGLKVLVVARTGLGTVNHIALTDVVLRGLGLPPIGFVLDNAGGPAVGSDRVNLGALTDARIHSPLLAEIPYAAAPTSAQIAPLVEAVRAALGV